MQTITRTYDRFADARAAVMAVKSLGVAEDDISVIANSDHPDSAGLRDMSDEGSAAGAGAGIGTMLGGGAGLLAGLGLMAIPGAGPLVAAGWLASTAVGAVAGGITGAATGGLISALTDTGVAQDEANTYAEAVRRGAILVSVRTTADNEEQVRAALDRNNPTDLALRRNGWMEEGWTSYDPAAPSYTSQQVLDERNRYP
jgi:hypothetical protein